MPLKIDYTPRNVQLAPYWCERTDLIRLFRARVVLIEYVGGIVS